LLKPIVQHYRMYKQAYSMVTITVCLGSILWCLVIPPSPPSSSSPSLQLHPDERQIDPECTSTDAPHQTQNGSPELIPSIGSIVEKTPRFNLKKPAPVFPYSPFLPKKQQKSRLKPREARIPPSLGQSSSDDSLESRQSKNDTDIIQNQDSLLYPSPFSIHAMP